MVGSISSNSVALLSSSMTEGPSLSKATRSSSALPPNDRQRYPLWWKSDQELVLSCSMNKSCSGFSDDASSLLRDSTPTTCVEKKLDSGRGRSQSALWSAAKISDYRKRLGLHRPGKTTFSSIRFSALIFSKLALWLQFSISDLSAKGPDVSGDQTGYAP